MKLSTEEIGRVLQVKPTHRGYSVRYVSIDSRQILAAKQTLFFALKGSQADGHDYIEALYKKGVRNFVVRQKPSHHKCARANFFVVKNVKLALQKLAIHYRKTLTAKVIGITGSNGKTIIKEWLATMLQPLGPVAKSPKSYNSQIGVPLSIFQIGAQDKICILEAGISTKGEMAKLQKMILPDIGILSNIGSAHDAGFENRKAKTTEKLKLFKNADTLIYCSNHAWIKGAILPKAAIRFDWTKKKKGQLHSLKFDVKEQQTIISLIYNEVSYTFETGFTDDASLENIMHCIGACFALGMNAKQIQDGLNKLYSLEMRLQMLAGENQCTLINDAYTADIESLIAGLDFQERQRQGKLKTVILSDFLQTGKGGQNLYKKIAALLIQYQIEKVVGIGSEVVILDRYLGEKIKRVFFRDTQAFLAHHSSENYIKEIILVKGARRFRFERIIDRLMARQHAAVLQINLSAMLNNVDYFGSKLKKGTKMLAMIKASGYGSGSVQIANLLEKSRVGYFGVAYPDEGIDLRKNGIQKPIMVLNCPTASFDSIILHDLEPVIYSLTQLQGLVNTLKKGQHMKIHLEIETGMNRLGFIEEDWAFLVELLQKNKQLVKVKSIFTHLAASDLASEDAFTKAQISRYNKAYRYICNKIKSKSDRHVLNTSGILRFPQYQYDMVRLGLGLYGIDPTALVNNRLQEVLTFKATVSQIKDLAPGNTIGYNRAGKVKSAKKIAILNVGYADGLLRKAGNGRFKVAIGGKLAPTIGNICMDMSMIDISKIPNVKIGDEVIIFGKAHPISHLCKALDTIPYEIYTSISERIKRVYYQE